MNIKARIYLKLDIYSNETLDMFKEYLPLTYDKYVDNNDGEHEIIDNDWSFTTLIYIFQDYIDVNLPDTVFANGAEINLLYNIVEE